jgi:hypothetical protein
MGRHRSRHPLPFAPTIFQAEVEGHSDLRVTVVGEQLFAAEIMRRTDLPDGRLDLDAPYVPHNLPGPVSESLLDLMHRLGLVFATIDMRITPEGEYVFFEAIPRANISSWRSGPGCPSPPPWSSSWCPDAPAHPERRGGVHAFHLTN